MAEINPVQHPQPLPRVERVRRDYQQPGREKTQPDDREERDEQPPNQPIDEYA